MLSISKPFKGAGQGDYYLNLSREDYYLQGGEPPGFWLGTGAETFGLSGALEPEAFRNLLRGFSPDGTRRLVHNAGSSNRRAGWDLTWSAPKSVSVAWSQAPEAIRQDIQAALKAAVLRGIEYLEEVGVVSRRGTDGVIHEAAKLTFAGFEHSTSRAQDPQLHIHTILVNTALRPDGSTGTLEPRALYRHQMAAGALFRAELAARLENRIGLRARQEGRAFELLGVDRELVDAFSKRRADIQAALRESGFAGAKAAEVAALNTRKPKEVLPRAELFKQWKALGKKYHWTTPELRWLMDVPYPARDKPQETADTANAAISNLTEHESHFSVRQLTRAIAEQAQGRGLGAKEVLGIRDALLRSPELVRLGGYKGEVRWTTAEMLALEKALLASADSMQRAERPVAGAEFLVREALSRRPELSAEQREAISHVCEAAGGVRVVSGMAGTGKSTLFAVAARVWRSQGRRVHGAALAGKAASGLQEATRIASQTIHRTLRQLESGQLTLDPRSVMVIDEAGMVGTRQLKTLIAACRQAGATLVLCGDARQLQPIEAGGAFAALAQRYDAAALTDIRRQRDEWARQTVREFAEGQALHALAQFEQRGLLSLSTESAKAMTQLIGDWRTVALQHPEGVVILAGTNADVYQLNALAQFERLQAAQLSGPGVAVGRERFFDGDRIVFTRNSAKHGVFNGDLGTVQAVTEKNLAVKLDSGRTVCVPLADYDHVRLAYAITTHKAQGMTAEHAFVLLDERMQDRELTYVQASRARIKTHLYGVAEEPEALAPAMSRPRQKLLASAILQGQELTLRYDR